jgi:hypothetical protein
MDSAGRDVATYVSTKHWEAWPAAALPDPSPLSEAGAGAAVLPLYLMRDDLKGLPRLKVGFGLRLSGFGQRGAEA